MRISASMRIGKYIRMVIPTSYSSISFVILVSTQPHWRNLSRCTHIYDNPLKQRVWRKKWGPPPKKKTPHFCATQCCVDCWGCSAPPHHLVTALGLSGNHQPSSCIVMSMLPVVIDIVAGFKLSHRRIFHKCEFTCAPNVTGCAVTKAKPSIEITESRTNTITVGVWIQIQLWVLCRCGVIALTAAGLSRRGSSNGIQGSVQRLLMQHCTPPTETLSKQPKVESKRWNVVKKSLYTSP